MSVAQRILRQPRRFWAWLLAFVAQREDATSLALFRIVTGTTLFCHLQAMIWSGGGQFAFTAFDIDGIGQRARVLDYVGGATPTNVMIHIWITAIAALFVALGLFTRFSVLVAWLAFRALVDMSTDARSGYDSLMIDTLFILLLSGSGNVLSVDARLFHKPRDVARWPRMLAVLQIFLLYTGSAVMKASSGWVPGGEASALWYILQQPMWSRLTELPTWSYPITQVATTASWLWELSAPLFFASVLFRESTPNGPPSRLRRILERIHFRELWLVVGVGVHCGIELFMEVGAFTGASLALYFCAVRPHEWRELPAKIRASLSRSRVGG